MMRVRVVVAAVAAAFSAMSVPLHAGADTTWWAPLGFVGHDVTGVSVDGVALVATVDGTPMVSVDGGDEFTPTTPVAPPAVVTAGGISWSIVAGRVLTGATPSSLHPDPGAPFLGATASYIAAPGATPGLVVAAGTDGHVWRRTPDGAWTTALVLLPAGGFSGPPAVTGLAAFTPPVSPAVYLATDGEGVLLTSDGGADWTRTDGTGLPDHVHALAVSNTARCLYAATDDGLWVHVLQAQPAPPVYHDASLWLRWLGIAAIAFAAAAAAVVALRRLAPVSPPPGT